MSKVICDVCGTTYPETATQCPICASAKNSSNPTAAGDSIASGYVHTKGGHFSKSNVKKRNKGASTQRRSSGSGKSSKNEEPNNTGLVIVVVLLLVAIIMMLVYIGVRYFKNNQPDPTDPPQPSESTAETTLPTETDPVIEVIECQGIELSSIIVELLAEGESWTLTTVLTPADTNEELIFTSADESIATVTSDGVITAVSGGKTVITVTCGKATASCEVACKFGDYVAGDIPADQLVFAWNTPYVDSSTGYGDATLSGKGTTWRAYKNSLNVDPEDIVWTSDDESIVTVVDGIVTVVGSGTTKIHAQYGSRTFTCIIRAKS